MLGFFLLRERKLLIVTDKRVFQISIWNQYNSISFKELFLLILWAWEVRKQCRRSISTPGDTGNVPQPHSQMMLGLLFSSRYTFCNGNNVFKSGFKCREVEIILMQILCNISSFANSAVALDFQLPSLFPSGHWLPPFRIPAVQGHSGLWICFLLNFLANLLTFLLC